MYILRCFDESYYTGSTKDIDKRLLEHNTGKGANHTRKRLPVTLIYYEELMEGKLKELINYSKNYSQFGDPSTGSGSEAGH